MSSGGTPHPNYRTPLWARRLGFFEWNRRYIRSPWIELSVNPNLVKIVSASICKFEDNWSAHAGLFGMSLFLTLPFQVRKEPKEMMEQWGFSVYRSKIHLNWGSSYKILNFPWDWTFHSRHLWDGQGWRPEPKIPRYEEKPDWLAEETYPYLYLLPSGEVQEVQATIHAIRMEWRWRGLKWLPWPRRVSRSIEVRFSGEVGEKAGSWKGGVTGCGYGLRRDETMRECLMRMQRERTFQ